LFTGIKHEDILSELEKEINVEDIREDFPHIGWFVAVFHQ
jgi:uncharacterized protein (DUF433 family)